MRTLLQALAGLAFLCAATAAYAGSGDDEADTAIDDTPHITIVGTASMEVVPDMAEISLGVTTERPGAAAASADNARAAQTIIEAAKAQGIESKDIRTQSVTLSEVFDDIHDPDGRYAGRKPRGYAANNSIVIRLRALDRAGALAQSLIEKGATQFDGIDFSLEHPEIPQDRLLAEAVRDARRKASIATQALGVTLGRVLLIERPQDGGERPAMQSRMAKPAMAMAAPPVPVEAGTQRLESTMVVTFALQP